MTFHIFVPLCINQAEHDKIDAQFRGHCTRKLVRNLHLTDKAQRNLCGFVFQYTHELRACLHKLYAIFAYLFHVAAGRDIFFGYAMIQSKIMINIKSNQGTMIY